MSEHARVCHGCGATAPGLHPEGWDIQPITEPGARYGLPEVAHMVVGERALCPDCRGAGKAVA